MKRFSAQYIITNSGPPLKRAIITTEDDGTVISVDDTGGNLTESHSVEFYNGIITPGFVNCHCHLELSHLRGRIAEGGGLGSFIKQILSIREINTDTIIRSASDADSDMYKSGVSLCADICNTPNTFSLKRNSKIKYINLLEVFGIDPYIAEKRLSEILSLAAKAEDMELCYSIVPHSAYSLSRKLFGMLRELNKNNIVTSIHFMESDAEKIFLRSHSSMLLSSYERASLSRYQEEAETHIDTILNQVTPSGHLILVHNTFADRDTIKAVSERDNISWCLCPDSNHYIERAVPPVSLLLEEGCEIVIGTDSLASNTKLDILREMITLQMNFPSLGIEDLIAWATINGARALGEEKEFGKIGPGMKPGLLLLENVDLENMKLLPTTVVTRLA
jgi:aminodeoxyfutalosine deaminase